jgi:hypothetical protein
MILATFSQSGLATSKIALSILELLILAPNAQRERPEPAPAGAEILWTETAGSGPLQAEGVRLTWA